MSRSKLHSRPEQVSELTRGLILPLPPLQEKALLIIAETLARAWNDLSARHANIFRSGDEAEISALLETRLNALLDEDPCWATLANGVSRGRETTSFDGSHLEKRPDLSIHLTCRSFSFPLVAECKLIDRVNRKTVQLYCAQGLARFIRGDYAWATREAFMLAYVRDDTSINDCLLPHLTKAQRKSTDSNHTERLPTSSRLAVADLACSQHLRKFQYIHQSPSTPGPIDLWHLWLQVPKQP